MSILSRRKEMARLLAQRERQGLTYRELSERSGIPAHTLSWWAWKLRQDPVPRPSFVELELEEATPTPAIEVETPGGHVLRLREDFDPALLRRVLEVLATC